MDKSNPFMSQKELERKETRYFCDQLRHREEEITSLQQQVRILREEKESAIEEVKTWKEHAKKLENIMADDRK